MSSRYVFFIYFFIYWFSPRSGLLGADIINNRIQTWVDSDDYENVLGTHSVARMEKL